MDFLTNDELQPSMDLDMMVKAEDDIFMSFPQANDPVLTFAVGDGSPWASSPTPLQQPNQLSAFKPTMDFGGSEMRSSPFTSRSGMQPQQQVASTPTSSVASKATTKTAPTTMHSAFSSISTDFEDDEDDEDLIEPRCPNSTRLQQMLMTPSGPIPKTFAELTDHQIATIDFKELMRLMEEAKMSPQTIAETKARRRRLKNRLSARVCSNKKREKCNELMDTNRQLATRLKTLEKQNKDLKRRNTELESLNASLVKSNSEASQECLQLRSHVAHLQQLLVQAGLLSAVDAAAFAA